MDEVNIAISTISLLSILANYFEKQKEGSIAVISSVAGEKEELKIISTAVLSNGYYFSFWFKTKIK